MKPVLFSFDIEEFDVPLEYNKVISFENQLKISIEGTSIVLDLLRESGVKATFFSTATFAMHATPIIDRLCAEGHELASHGFYHSEFEEAHLAQSKAKLEEISQREVVGFRMPRMMPIDNGAILRAGYTYDSSLNPIFLPGRYNNFSRPREPHRNDGLLEIPASTTPLLRIPLFWLSFHNFPLWFYKQACRQTMDHDGHLNLYFHPWEFVDLTLSEFGLPWFVSKNSGTHMIERFRALIYWMKLQGFKFTTFKDFIKTV